MARPKGSKHGSGKRKSKAESATGAKDNAAEMRTPDQGEMELPKSDDILFHMRSIKGAKERLTTVSSLVRTARKAAKKVHKLLPEIIDELLALERSDDPTEFKRRMDLLGAGLKAVGAPYQISIFDTLAGDVQDQAYQRGFGDGKAGRTANCPYPEKSDLAEQYLCGWRNAQSELLGLPVEERVAAVNAAEDGEDDDDSLIGHNSNGESELAQENELV